MHSHTVFSSEIRMCYAPAMHNHSHHDHHHAPADYNTAFALAFSLNLIYTLVEAGFAIHANSMSLLADAGHNLGDVVGIGMAWLANWLLQKPASDRYSYGFRRATVIAALFNALFLIFTSGLIAYEAIQQFMNPAEIKEHLVIIVALVGIFINGGTAMLFMRGRHSDLNIKGAYLHLAADALVSIGVVITAVIILYTGWDIIDPIVGLLIVVTILLATWELLRDSVNLIMDAVPHSIDRGAVIEYLAKIEGVTAVHDVHIWGLSTREVALTAHMVMPERQLTDEDYQEINHQLLHLFAIHHVTIQVERGDSDEDCCGTSCEDH